MALLLSVLRYKNQTPADAVAARFTDAKVTIGRKPGNTWVLPDPDNYVSKRHCAIVTEGDGAYQVTDLSSNGTYVNAAATPLGQGRSAALDGKLRKLGIEQGDFGLAIRHDGNRPGRLLFCRCRRRQIRSWTMLA
jgi:type VI secretion system protein